MKRIEKILLCGKIKDGSTFLFISDGVKAYIYKAWNSTGKNKVSIPEFLTAADGKRLKVSAVGWNSVAAEYTNVKNRFSVEMMINTELT